MFDLLKPNTRRKLLCLSLMICIILLKMPNCIGGGNKVKNRPYRDDRYRTTTDYSRFPLPRTKQVCVDNHETLRARHKSCFLRPDSGPCRADIIQWYFDVKLNKCFRFFWGGCQGNGNRFETLDQCNKYCFLNMTTQPSQIPHFCSLTFDYGNCFGYYHRWTWDRMSKSCRHRIYSGCGGNQNNFETYEECLNTCLRPPNNTLQRNPQFTTCIAFRLAELY